MHMFVNKNYQIKFDMMLWLLTHQKWEQANARRVCLHRNEELDYSKLQKKIQRGKKKKSVAFIQFHR